METLKGLKAKVKEKGITWQELAQGMGVTYQTLHRKRRGLIAFTLSDLEKIAQVLGCSVDDLLHEETKKEQRPAGVKQ